MKPKTIKFNPDELVAIFNLAFPVDSTVKMRTVAHDSFPYREYTVSYPAENHFGMPVAWVKERSGMCSIEPQFVDYGDKLNSPEEA